MDSLDQRRREAAGPLWEDPPEVATKLTDALKSRDAGIPVIGSKETLGTFLPRWLEAHRHRVRPRVWDRYEQLVRIHAFARAAQLRVSTRGVFHDANRRSAVGLGERLGVGLNVFSARSEDGHPQA